MKKNLPMYYFFRSFNRNNITNISVLKISISPNYTIRNNSRGVPLLGTSLLPFIMRSCVVFPTFHVTLSHSPLNHPPLSFIFRFLHFSTVKNTGKSLLVNRHKLKKNTVALKRKHENPFLPPQSRHHAELVK